jgi:hypothetical protein
MPSEFPRVIDIYASLFRLADLISRGDAPIYYNISSGCTVIRPRLVLMFIGEQDV